MDFIEQWFHVSPDNGSGATELVYIIVIAAAVVLLWSRRRIIAFAKWCADRIWKNR